MSGISVAEKVSVDQCFYFYFFYCRSFQSSKHPHNDCLIEQTVVRAGTRPKAFLISSGFALLQCNIDRLMTLPQFLARYKI